MQRNRQRGKDVRLLCTELIVNRSCCCMTSLPGGVTPHSQSFLIKQSLLKSQHYRFLMVDSCFVSIFCRVLGIGRKVWSQVLSVPPLLLHKLIVSGAKPSQKTVPRLCWTFVTWCQWQCHNKGRTECWAIAKTSPIMWSNSNSYPHKDVSIFKYRHVYVFTYIYMSEGRAPTVKCMTCSMWSSWLGWSQSSTRKRRQQQQREKHHLMLLPARPLRLLVLILSPKMTTQDVS